MKKRIAVLPGDGIGPEVMAATLNVLDAALHGSAHSLYFESGLIGGAAYDVHGEHFPEPTKTLCASCDAILFGSVGGPVQESQKDRWKNCERNSILALRKTFQFFANLRPTRVFPGLAALSPLRPEVLSAGVDFIIVRELIDDIYFGRHERFEKDAKRHAEDVAHYSEDSIAQVAHLAFQLAQKRGRRLCSVDKQNVLSTSALWREVVSEIAREYPDVTLAHMLVDNCALQLMKNPGQFDVILTSNLFGDILSDEASAIPGSLGLSPSASINSQGFAMYEPSGGSAPDIAGQDKANPIAQILSAAMMLRNSFAWDEAATRIETAVEKALADGARTADIALSEEAVLSERPVLSTTEMMKKILDSM